MEIKNFKFKKKYGQNFLIDENLAKNIIDKIDDGNDKILLEIGPGLGALTYHLLEKKGEKVLVEIDSVMVDHLNHQINDENVEIINKDFLNVNLNKYDKDIVVVANLPYYVTTDIVEKLIKCPNVKQMTLMVQKEAYNRLVSPINTKEYSPISIFIEYLGNVKVIQKVSRHSYIPEPHVDSLVFQINVTNDRKYVNEKLFFQVTKAMFKMRRKTILNIVLKN